MSAFVVGDVTINRVIAALTGGTVNNRESYAWDLRDVLKAADIASNDPEWRDKLGASMFQMNCDAVNERYGQGEASQFRPLDYAFEPQRPTTEVAAKCLACYLYQCSEGDVPDRPLYKALHEFEHSLLKEIARKVPAYEQAEW